MGNAFCGQGAVFNEIVHHDAENKVDNRIHINNWEVLLQVIGTRQGTLICHGPMTISKE
jgi:hypothetical protein